MESSHKSNHHIIYFDNITILFINYISIKLKKELRTRLQMTNIQETVTKETLNITLFLWLSIQFLVLSLFLEDKDHILYSEQFRVIILLFYVATTQSSC